MRILIIGGTLFIGAHLARQLLIEGHEIVFLNRGKTAPLFTFEAEVIRADRSRLPSLRQKLEKRAFDAVVDMLAMDTISVRQTIEALEGDRRPDLRNKQHGGLPRAGHPSPHRSLPFPASHQVAAQDGLLANDPVPAGAQTDSTTKKIRLWTDRSGNTRHAENSDSATQPTLVDDALHGLPMVQFGSDAFLAVGDIRPEAGPITTFVVSRSDSTEGDRFQRLVTGYITGSGNNWEAPNYFVSRPHLENDTPQAYDGEITSQSDTGRALQNILLGVQSSNVNDFHDLIGEFLIFARSLTPSETAAVEAYLADKWQLWETLPASHSQRIPDGYAAWLWSQPQLVGENANPDADPKQNGLSNFFEYVLGLNPLALEPPPADLLSMTIHGGVPAIQLRALADFSHRGLQLAIATSLESPTWSLPGDDAHIPFEPVTSAPTATPGVANTLLAPAAPLPAKVFIRLQK